MSGFPPVDTEFYSKNPLTSIERLGRLNGAINEDSISAHIPDWTEPEQGEEVLAALRNPRTLLIKRFRDLPLSFENLRVSFRARRFASLRDLQRFLKATHRRSYWYRGQNRQYQAVFNGRIEQFEEINPRLKAIEIAFESLIPSFFRPVAIHVPARWDESGVRSKPPLDHFPAIARAIMRAPASAPAAGVTRSILKTYLTESTMPAILREMTRFNEWRYRHEGTLAARLPGTNVFESQLQMISLAQHYEYGSMMVDVTRSVDVAAWLASHRWSDGELYGQDGEGVIYRFDHNVISRTVRQLLDQAQPPLLSHLGLFGLVDISTKFSGIARRPVVQQGGSLLGLENSLIYLLLLQDRGIDVFTFPQASSDGSETPFSKDALCPKDDPALEVFCDPGSEDGDPITVEELSAFLTACETPDDVRRQVIHLRTLGVL